MNKINKKDNMEYCELVETVGEILADGKKEIVSSINKTILESYWKIGRNIVEFEQNGNERAKYGSELLRRLAKDLTVRYGKGFGLSNINKMRKLYLCYPILQTLSANLSWSHYVELLKVEDKVERSFYEKECEIEKWGVRELKRQMKSMLFHRIALSSNKKEIMDLSKKGQIIEGPEDILKEPYVFEFVGFQMLPIYTEGELEEALISNLSQFLLELGKGFTYVGRQQTINVGGRYYKIDLVFYHRILKCFVLFDLKQGEITHEDIGQMNFYLNYYREEVNEDGDGEPIGIVLGTMKDKLVMKYALQNIRNQLFVKKYQLYLPNKDQLEKELNRFLGR